MPEESGKPEGWIGCSLNSKVSNAITTTGGEDTEERHSHISLGAVLWLTAFLA